MNNNSLGGGEGGGLRTEKQMDLAVYLVLCGCGDGGGKIKKLDSSIWHASVIV